MSQQPDREVVHLRQDLRAAQEVIQLLEGENERLKQSIHGIRRDHQRELNALADAKAHFELKLREVEGTADSYKGENQRLRGEINEAVEERERQAALLKDVRLQVDGRLTRFVEALHAKDEELHKLQYLAQERERDRDRVQLLEKMLSSREENVNSLLSQLSTARTEHAELSAELRHKSTLIDQQSRQLSMVREEPAASPPKEDRAGKNSDLLAVIPLYRQWSTAFCKEVEELEDGMDAILDTATDLRVTLEGGDPSSLKQDRARLHSRRKLERDRAQAHSGMLESASVHSDNTALVQVHAIRANCDTSRHGMTKIRDTLSYLKESLHNLQMKASTTPQQVIVKADPQTLPTPQSTGANASYWQSIAEEREARFRVVQEELYASKEKAMAAESSHKAVEQQCTRYEKDLTTLRDEVARLSGELSERQKLHYSAHDTHLGELDALRQRLSDLTASHAADKSAADERYKKASSEAWDRWEAERSSLKEQLSEARMKVDELTQLASRSQHALDEARSKRQALKADHDRLEAEYAEMRTTYTTQNQELRQTQEVADSLAQELAHVKAVLDFETQQYEHREVGSAGGSPTDFDAWKKQKQRDPRAAQRSGPAAPRQVVIHRR